MPCFNNDATMECGRNVSMVKIFQWQGNEKAAEFSDAVAVNVCECVLCMCVVFLSIHRHFLCMFDVIFHLPPFKHLTVLCLILLSQKRSSNRWRAVNHSQSTSICYARSHIYHMSISHTKKKAEDRVANARARESAHTESPIHISPFQLWLAGPYIRHAARKKQEAQEHNEICIWKFCWHYKCCVFCACIMIGNWLLWQEHEHESDRKTNLFIFYIYFLVVGVGYSVVLPVNAAPCVCVFECAMKTAELDVFTNPLSKTFLLVVARCCALRMCLFASLAILINSSLIEEVWVCLPDSQTCQKLGPRTLNDSFFLHRKHCKIVNRFMNFNYSHTNLNGVWKPQSQFDAAFLEQIFDTEIYYY